MKRYITDYSPEELKQKPARDVKILMFHPTNQNYSAYLKVCRKFEEDLAWIESSIQNEVRFVRPTNNGEKAMLEAVEQHEKRLQEARKEKKKILLNIAKEIVGMELLMERRGEEYTPYPVNGIEEILAFGEGIEEVKNDVKVEEIESDEVIITGEDIYIKAEEIITAVEAFLPSLDKEEAKEITQRIKTPLKTALKNRNVKMITEKTAQLEDILNKD